MPKTKKNQETHNIAGECVIPLMGILFTVYYVYSIVDAPWTAQVNAVLVGTTLIIVSTLFLIKKKPALFLICEDRQTDKS